MSTRHLERLLNPRSVALIGASERPHSVGAVTLRNLRDGGFAGALYLVNPHAERLDGLPVHRDVQSLPAAPDLAVIATPPDQVVKTIADLGALGTRAAVVITAGFGEAGAGGAALQQDLLAAARPYDLRVVGPNCVGIVLPAIGLNASFAQAMPPPGEIAFLSQSGAMITTLLDWAQPRNVGFSHIVSLGDMADVDFGDLLAYLDGDERTRAVVLYVEGITHAAKFLAAARALARTKPLLALKVGRHAASAKAAHSHTGALAGSDAVYDAAFRSAGILRVDTLPQLLDGLSTLAVTRPFDGDRLAILTNGGGPGVIATDALVAAGGRLAPLEPQTIAALDALLPKTWSGGNPVDMVGDASAQQYARTLATVLADATTDAVLVLNCPTALTDPLDGARAVVETLRANPPAQKAVFTAWLGEKLAGPARALLAGARIATYETPEDAVQGFAQRVQYARTAQAFRDEPPPAPEVPVDAAGVRAIVERALARDERWLDAEAAAAVLRAYGIPALRARAVADAASAAAAAAEFGGAVALKIRSQQIVHKSDAGGVALGLTGADAVGREAEAMLARIALARPDARIDGFLVQEMAARDGALELIAGVNADPVFGPVVLFGQGGTAVEVIADTSVALPPLTGPSARALMARTRIWRQMRGYRTTPPVDIEALADVLVRVGRLALDHPAITELDLNPLLARERGVVTVDARIGLAAAPG